MVIVDTSAWIEYFRHGKATVAESVDHCLSHDLVGIGDLVYCEVVQGLYNKRERESISSFLLSLPMYDLVGFRVAEKAAENYRLLRSKGITIRKTIDVLIGTFCAENQFTLLHSDRDFHFMAPHIGLVLYDQQHLAE